MKKLWKVKSLVLTVLIGIANVNCFGKDLGMMGEVYPISEIDLLDFIKERIAQMQTNGEWQKVEKNLQNKAIQLRTRPKPVDNITRTTLEKNWRFDPSIHLDHDVFAPNGKLIAKAGTHVNPLIYVSLNKTIMFFDSDDAEQVTWIKKQLLTSKKQIKLILINGDVIKTENLLNHKVYFDQQGRLVTRFNISHVPATVSQDGMALQIREIKI